MTYRVYLRNADSLVTEKTMTGDPEAAIAAFTALTERVELDGQQMVAVLARSNTPVAHHNFSRPAPPAPGCNPGQWWRGRTAQIDLTSAA